METVPSPIEVTNWPQVVALGLLLAAFVVIPAIIGHLSNRPIKKTLTEKNGGHSIIDYLTRIEKRQVDQGKQLDEQAGRLSALEGATITEESFRAPNP